MRDVEAASAPLAPGNEGRLKAFLYSAGVGTQAACPSEILRALGGHENTLSSHLTNLRRAGLLERERKDRSIA